MFRPEIRHAVEEITKERFSDPRALPYSILLKCIGVDSSKALTIIPFLHRDTHYLPIPGRIIRINDLENSLQKLVDSSEIQEKMKRYQSTLPDVPLIPLDLRHGIPDTFKSQFGEADLFIVNHGIILSGLDINDPNSARTYLSSIGNATREGSLLMIIDSVYEPIYRPDQIAQIIGSTPLNDAIDSTTSNLLDDLGLRKRSLNQSHNDGLNHLGDYINLPESHENDRLFFFTKN